MTAAARASLAGKRIVVVEDDFLLASDICNELRKLGAAVLGPAPTPFYAEQLMSSRRIDVAVLDIRLHSANVFEVADRLRSRGVSILFVTATEPEDLPIRFRDAPYLQKPVDHNQLVAKVVELTRFQPQATQGRLPSPHGQTGGRTPALMFALIVARQLSRN